MNTSVIREVKDRQGAHPNLTSLSAYPTSEGKERVTKILTQFLDGGGSSQWRVRLIDHAMNHVDAFLQFWIWRPIHQIGGVMDGEEDFGRVHIENLVLQPPLRVHLKWPSLWS